jgi:PII-like signaling protein
MGRHAIKHEKQERRAKMLRIFIDEADSWEDDPLHEAIVKKMQMMNIAGATVFRGLLGYGSPKHLHHLGWLGNPTDLPIMVSIVDTEEKINEVLPVLDEMVDEGLIVLSDVEVIKYTHKRSQGRTP